MAEAEPRLYEGMFLMDQQQMAGDMSAAFGHVQQVLDRRQAEVLSLRKWDERRLAYEINGQKRGTYLLALFRAEPSQIAGMERDVNLSDELARALFTRADHMGETEIQAEIDAARGERDEAKAHEGEGPVETPEEQAEDESEPGPEDEPAVAAGDEAGEAGEARGH